MTARICVITTTCASDADATQIARALVESGLAACVQITPIRSVYRWRGAIHDEEERLLAIKAKRDDWRRIEAAIRAAHKYDVPEILMFDVAEASKDYLDFVLGPGLA